MPKMAMGMSSSSEATSGLAAVAVGGYYDNNYSLILDGTDDYVNFSDIEDVTTGDFSFFAWVKSSSTSIQIIAMKGYAASEANGSPGWYFYLKDDGALVFGLGSNSQNGGTTYKTSTDSNANDGDWHHVGFTVDRDGDVIFYQDGSANGNETIGGQTGSITNNYPFLVGINYNKDTTKNLDFNGNIDEVAIWKDQILSANAISTIYNSGSPTNLAEESGDYTSGMVGNLIGYFRFENDYTDSSTNSATGTAVNNATFSETTP